MRINTQNVSYIEGRHIERERGMDIRGKGLMAEFDEAQNEDMFGISARELAYYNSRMGINISTAANSISLTSSFVRICTLPKPVVVPSPPSPGLNPSTARLLFKKDLKLSDVGLARRIIIPKAHAENYMPRLTDGDGIFIFMDDMDGDRVWVFRFRYWQNNNSRMFVLEKTGDFVKAHNLGAGDVVLIYIDEQTGRYGIQAKKGEKKEVNPSDSENVPMSCYGNFFARDEIEAYAYPEYNVQNFMNFLGGTELAIPNVEQSMSFDPANIYPQYYF